MAFVNTTRAAHPAFGDKFASLLDSVKTAMARRAIFRQTMRELRALYAELDWPAPGHALTDMHDWGDMLVHAGFAEPIMDMERITLTFATPQRLLQELRGLGRNLHPQRFAALRGRNWRARLEQALAQRLADAGADGQLALTFEIIYGHAFKPAPRVRLEGSSAVSLQDMRAMLHAGRSATR